MHVFHTKKNSCDSNAINPTNLSEMNTEMKVITKIEMVVDETNKNSF